MSKNERRRRVCVLELRTVVRTCPTCQHTLDETAPGSFCSARCKWVDLGKWLDGDYVIPGQDGDAALELSEEVVAAISTQARNSDHHS